MTPGLCRKSVEAYFPSLDSGRRYKDPFDVAAACPTQKPLPAHQDTFRLRSKRTRMQALAMRVRHCLFCLRAPQFSGPKRLLAHNLVLATRTVTPAILRHKRQLCVCSERKGIQRRKDGWGFCCLISICLYNHFTLEGRKIWTLRQCIWKGLDESK